MICSWIGRQPPWNCETRSGITVNGSYKGDSLCTLLIKLEELLDLLSRSISKILSWRFLHSFRTWVTIAKLRICLCSKSTTSVTKLSNCIRRALLVKSSGCIKYLTITGSIWIGLCWSLRMMLNRTLLGAFCWYALICNCLRKSLSSNWARTGSPSSILTET